LIDPKGFGVPWTNSMLTVFIRDDDSINPAALKFRILELNANNELQKTWNVNLGTGGTYDTSLKNYTLDKYNSGVKFLLEVVEPGTKKTTMNVKWKF